MSLTNDQITAQNFKDFYQQLLPYLGKQGSVPTFANQFNRSDLYSTDEQLIGRWIDGKPLYQKSVTGTTPSASADVPTNIGSGIEMCLLKEVFILNASVGYNITNSFTLNLGAVSVDVQNNGANIYFYYKDTPTMAINQPFVATLIYTKTSDASIAIGSDTDYSTDEKIVGTWIDGKPIYQRTYDEGQDVIVESSQWYESTHDATNIAKYISAEFTLSGGNNMYPGMIGTTTVGATGQKVVGLQNCLNRSFKFRYMTIRYTKNTD